MSDLCQSPIVVRSVMYKDVTAAVSWLESAYGAKGRQGSGLAGDNLTHTRLEVGAGGLLHHTAKVFTLARY